MQIFKHNSLGTDYVVGDVHGQIERLVTKLEELGFTSKKDRLFCTGDFLSDDKVVQDIGWLIHNPCVKLVMGNHEWMDLALYEEVAMVSNLGDFIIKFLTALPVAIQINDEHGNPRVGIVHAQAPEDWLNQDPEGTTLWSRKRFELKDMKGTQNIEKVYIGHSRVAEPTAYGNNIYIDTDFDVIAI